MLAAHHEVDKAYETGISMLEFSAGFRSAHTTILTVTGADIIASRGSTCLLALIEHHPLEREALAGLARRLEDLSISDPGMETVLRASYQSYFSAGGEPMKNHCKVLNQGSRVPLMLVYKPNRTRSMYAGAYGAAVRNASSSYSGMLSQLDSVNLEDWKFRWSETLTGNSLGYDVFERDHGMLLSILKRSSAVNAGLPLLRVRIAMERYRLDHGAWPETLDALIPSYLDSIPLDPMDGKSLRYNATKRILYSIGTDFVDDGGVAPDKSGSLESRLEIVIELEPSQPSPWPSLLGEPGNTAD